MGPQPWRIVALFLFAFGGVLLPFAVVLPFDRFGPRDGDRGALESQFGDHPFVLVGLVLAYSVVWLVRAFRAGPWAARVEPEPGIVPVEADVLRARLLALNDLGLPFQLREPADGRLKAEWRFADAKWVACSRPAG